LAEAGGIEGVLGGEPESTEGDAPAGGVDAVAVALALPAAHHDPELGRITSEYLAEQRALVKLQIKHFDEERRLAIAAAKRKRLSDRLRIGLQLFVVLVALGAVVGVAAMFWDALTDRGIKVEAFEVPAALTGKGLTGQIVAKKLLDRIAEIDRASTTVRAANSYANNWGKDIKVEVPETGISIGEISHWIHDRFGHATHVDGEVYYTGNGVNVSVRVGNNPVIETHGTEEELPTLIQAAATRVYAQTQPYRYGFWLASQGQIDEANANFQQLYIEGSPVDRIWALHGLANDQESPEKEIALEQRVLAADPHFLLSALNVASAESRLGHMESALSKLLALLADKRGLADELLSPSGRTVLLTFAQQDRDMLLSDFQSADATANLLEDDAIPTNWRGLARQQRVEILIQLHDPQNAAELLELVPASKSARGEIRSSYLRSRLAAEGGNWAEAMLEIERTNATNHGESIKAIRLRNPLFAAELYAHAGRNAEADEMLASLAADNYDGWRARGRVATLRQDYPNGEQALAEAVRQAPSFAPAYNDWGDLLYAKGDLTGAITKYRYANQRSPHWADPLKGWGDVLAKQGNAKQALAMYEEALKYAPNWKKLKDLREGLAQHTG
jgi:tetratricopeptide (TPR) repeat protein